jgi:hypothetical protein
MGQAVLTHTAAAPHAALTLKQLVLIQHDTWQSPSRQAATVQPVVASASAFAGSEAVLGV